MDDLPISLIRHLADFGMLVILWLVQLVIYPSFLRIDQAALQDWHQRYTSRVAWVIIPIMFTQLPVVAVSTFLNMNGANVVALLSVVVCWILTFSVSVPLHGKISNGAGDSATLKRLIVTNWPRTILWTFAFILGVLP